MNGDGFINFLDISPFILALTDSAAYRTVYPALDPDVSGDTNGSGNINFLDISGFIVLLGS